MMTKLDKNASHITHFLYGAVVSENTLPHRAMKPLLLTWIKFIPGMDG